MTIFQKTLIEFNRGSKMNAFIMFLQDETSNSDNMSFNQFCSVFEKMTKNHINNLAINSVTKKREKPIWE
jgi:hypothetical protein